MNKLVIPPSANWYETDIMACASDNTLIYGSRQDIVVNKATSENEPDDVQVITRAHSMRIKSVNINRNWGQPHKYAVTVSEDKVVKLWDIELLEKKSSHNKHILHDDDTKVVGAAFAGDDRVVSISETGTVVIWNITKNETNVLNTLFDIKVTITCLSVCPHATWLAGFGLKNGLVAVADLRRTGKIIYKLRGHDKPVVSLSWCPVPVNIFPIKPNNKVVEKKLEESGEEVKIDTTKALEAVENSTVLKKEGVEESAEILASATKESSHDAEKEVEKSSKESSDADQEKTNRRKQKNPKKGLNPWVGLTHANDEPVQLIKKSHSGSDFLKECADLRQEILQMNKPKDRSNVEESSTQKEDVSTERASPRVILKPKNKAQKRGLSTLLLKKEQALQTEREDAQKDIVEKLDTSEKSADTVETPTDRSEMSMEMSHSVEKLAAKLTSYTEKSMEITTCGSRESVSTIETTLSDTDRKEECVYVSASSDDKDSSFESTKKSSSEESKKFSSVSSCDIDFNCSKRHSEVFEREIVKKSDTSSTSESGDIFHDAQVCDSKEVKGNVGCEVEEAANFEEQPRKEFLLASSARDSNIYIWRAGTDGRMQTFLTVPPVKSQKKPRPDKLWITICWVAPNILLSSSRTAELLQWTLPRPTVQTKFVRQIHKDHWSVLFSIKAPIVYLNEYNFLQKRDINAWTTGMERTILSTDIGSHKNLSCYPALGGSVNCITGSPLDPNRLAFGTGEGVVNVWDLSREHKKRVVFSTFYQKIISSVTALAWHPVIETSLAWATIEGRIGLLDTAGKGKSPKILPHYFKSQIHKMEWGPLNGDLTNPGLFVVSEAKVAVFNPKSQEKEPQLLETPDNTSVYMMSWKPDYSMLLVSSKSGSLITYTPDLNISNVSYLTVKLQSIVWNPNAFSNDTTVSKYCQTFVSIIRNTEFIVYNLAIQSENSDDKVTAHFANRNVAINSIEWNPHSGNQLVFVDEGGVAQVYDIEKKTVISTYMNPYLDAVLSVCWSPIDQDFIITGTVAHKIIVWNVSEHAALTEQEINSRRNKITKAQRKETSDLLLKEETEVLPIQEASEEPKSKKSTKSPILPMFYSTREKTHVQDIKKLLQWKLGDKSVEPNIGDSKYVDVLDVFADQGNMERVLNLNIAAFKQQGKHHNGNLLMLFKGDIDTAVKEAVEQNRVNPWIISMCPMVSPKLWQTACETYANQLLDEQEADPFEIVTYLLACHKIEESVDVLCERAMFREALALAKARFGGDNPIVYKILDQWAKNAVYHGNFEVAAQCYVVLDKFEDAASVLFRRSKVDMLKLAVELAQLSGNEELHKAVVFRFNAFNAEKDEMKDSQRAAETTNKENEKESSAELPKTVLPDSDSNQINDGDTVQHGNNIENAESGKSDTESLNNDITDYLISVDKHLCKLTETEHATKNDLELINKEENNASDIKMRNENENGTVLEVDKENKEQKLAYREEITEEYKGQEEKASESKSEDLSKVFEEELDDNSELKSGDELSKVKSASGSKNTEGDSEELPSLTDRANELDEVAQEALESEDELLSRDKEGTDVEVLSKKDSGEKREETYDKKTDYSVGSKPASELKDTGKCHVEILEKVKEFQPDLLKEKTGELDGVVQKIVESEEGLLSTDEVKSLLSKRKISSEGDTCVKEEKEE